MGDYSYTDNTGTEHSFNSYDEMEAYRNKQSAIADKKALDNEKAKLSRKAAWLPSTPENLIVRPRYTVDKTRGRRSYIKLITPLTDKQLAVRLKERNALSHNDSPTKNLTTGSTWSKLKNGTYAHFILDSARTNMSEKTQVVQTFGDAEVIYHFGRTPVVYSISGILLDDADNQWFTEFLTLYASTLRGTQLARNQELVEIGLPSVTLQGTITDFGYGHQANSDTLVQFNLSILVKDMAVNPVSTEFSEEDRWALMQAYPFSEDYTGPTVDQITITTSTYGGYQTISYASAVGLGLVKADIQMPISTDSPPQEIDSFDDPPPQTTDQKIVGAAEKMKGFLVNNILSPIHGLVTNIVKIATQISDYVEEKFNQLVAPVKQMINSAIKAWKKAWPKIKSMINDIRGKINAIKNKIKQLRQMIQNIKKAIGAIREFVQDVKAQAKLLNSQLRAAGAFGRGNSKYRRKKDKDAIAAL